MIDFSRFNSLIDLALYFNNQSICLKTIEEMRFPSGDVVCPYCGEHHAYRCADGRFKCRNCHKRFSILQGTIFENTKIKLTKWFMAMYLMSSHKKGISSCQIARDLGVTQTTGWYILHKIRTLFEQNDSRALAGEVECDEMYLGGREGNKHKSKRTAHTQGKSLKTKSAIFGMAERYGEAKAFVVSDTKSSSLQNYICQFVDDHATIFTDESSCYSGLDGLYEHHRVNHSEGEYVNGMYSTNTIEGFWGHFKRMVFGIYHFVSKERLQSYVDESVYRWNTRCWDEKVRFTDMFLKSMKVVSYQDILDRNLRRA